METVQEEKITFEQIKEVYKEMMKERAKEKFRNWDREYKKMRYHSDPEFRAKRIALSTATRLKKKAEKEATAKKIPENI
jgi:hypothetical protein